MKKLYCLLGLLFLVFTPLLPQAPFPKREMRAVWVATVRNIDWPSKPGLSVDEQKREMTALLDLHQANRMNTIAFQVRPACDALYNSPIEPWAKWITGTHGKAPEPFYDPLEFTIRECHQRNMELHAWFNPYRAVTGYRDFMLDSAHVAIRHPEWVITYGENKYLDPGLPEVRDYVTEVVADVVARYDIDAVHMDDYFYPYKIQGEVLHDDSTFYRHPRGFPPEARDDWRRDNVDLTIKQLRDTIKSLKPWVKFGISPFGVWRNRDKDPAGSATRAGQTNYDDLYADILKWLREGWIDYVVPQAYWHIGFEIADHRIISEWWNGNAFGKELFIGNSVYRMNRKSEIPAWRDNKEIIRQVELSRSLSNVSGNFYFSSRIFSRNPVKLNQAMQKKIYPYPALIPENPLAERLPPFPPPQPRLEKEGRIISLAWAPPTQAMDAIRLYYVVYRFPEKVVTSTTDPRYIFDVVPNTGTVISGRRKIFKKEYTFGVTAVNRFHYESDLSQSLKIKY